MSLFGSSAGKKKKKIAILGGGISALTTAYDLSSRPGWQDEYDITVYQIGWRLGGKGASGRNLDPDYHYRIQEHGIHVFFGFYDNAIHLLKQCYVELGRKPDEPLPTWDEAFKPQSFIAVTERLFASGPWRLWSLNVPLNSSVPGEGGVFPGLIDYVEEAVELLFELFKCSYFSTMAVGLGGALEDDARRLERLFDLAIQSLSTDERTIALNTQRSLNYYGKLFHFAREIARHIGRAERDVHAALLTDAEELPSCLDRFLHGLTEELRQDGDRFLFGCIVHLLKEAMAWLRQEMHPLLNSGNVDVSIDPLLLWVSLNYGFGNLRGAYRCDLIHKGIESINDQDYAAWLGKYVIPDFGITANSALVRWLYDAVFAYRGGRHDQPALEAGTAFQTLVRVIFTYKEAFTFKMQAGMGDVVFAPLYLVLARRGVRFEYFQRVVNLGLSHDRRSIARIELEQQAEVKPELPDGYDPLIDVKGLPCWPDRPLYDQIVDGDVLRDSGVNLESYTSTWSGSRPRTLLVGEDFDEVVLGISLAALPCVAKELIEASPDWQEMLARMGTVRTQGAQLWITKPLQALGWTKLPPILTAYDTTQLDTWVPMNQVLPREDWPPGPGQPKSLCYFCGFLEDSDDELPCAPATRLDAVKETAIELLREYVWFLWPLSTIPSGKQGAPFDWNLLVDDRPIPGQGIERMDAQYFVSIVNPSDRYVLTLPGSSQYRLRAGKNGFTNLFITGDWIQNTFNIGCVEASVMSGLTTANALRGRPEGEGIVGWGFLSGGV